jgi:hypothetical protein
VTKPPPSADGLLIDRPDELTPEEVEAFRAYYAQSKGQSLAGLEFWLELRPDVLKRYRLGVRETGTETGRAHPLMRGLAWLQYYTVSAYEEGIRYQLHNVASAGATRGMVLDTLAVAFLHSGPRGIDFVARSSMDVIRDWKDADPPGRWPEGWRFDPTALSSGADFSVAEASGADLAAIEGWYASTLGEVPGYVRFLARHRPNFLKAYRNRFEHAIRDALPVQMMAYLLLNLHVVHRFGDGIREAALLGRTLGMTNDALVDAVLWGFYFGGVEAFSLVEDVAGDILGPLQ